MSGTEVEPAVAAEQSEAAVGMVLVDDEGALTLQNFH